MWQSISAADPNSIANAYAAISAIDVSWRNSDQLIAWMRGQAVFSFRPDDGSDFILFVGYSFEPTSAQWRLAIAGTRGDLSTAIVTEIAEQIIGLMRQQATRSMFVATSPRGNSDPIEVLCANVASTLRLNAAVLQVSEQAQGSNVFREIVLK